MNTNARPLSAFGSFAFGISLDLGLGPFCSRLNPTVGAVLPPPPKKDLRSFAAVGFVVFDFDGAMTASARDVGRALFPRYALHCTVSGHLTDQTCQRVKWATAQGKRPSKKLDVFMIHTYSIVHNRTCEEQLYGWNFGCLPYTHEIEIKYQKIFKHDLSKRMERRCTLNFQNLFPVYQTDI